MRWPVISVLAGTLAVAISACSSQTKAVAVFTPPSGPSRLIPLSADVPILTARLRSLGDVRARVVVQGNSIAVEGGGRLPAPVSFFVKPGKFTLRSVLCGAPSYQPVSNGGAAPVSWPLPACNSQYETTAGNLAVSAKTAQPTELLPPDLQFGGIPSSPEHDADTPSVSVLLATSGGGEPYPRLVLGPAEVTNSAIATSRAVSPPRFGQWTVDCTLTSQGTPSWNALAEDSFHEYIAVDMDGVVITAPLIEPGNSSFFSFGNQLQLSGNFTGSMARQLAALLSSGPLPAPLVPGR